MSTLVTKTNNKRFKKTAVVYTLITVFFFIFSRIYEHFSFGETSVYMHWLFGVPLIGGVVLLIFQRLIPNLSRLSLNLWNSAVATIAAGVLFRGIVNLSGRFTLLVCWTCISRASSTLNDFYQKRMGDRHTRYQKGLTHTELKTSWSPLFTKQESEKSYFPRLFSFTVINISCQWINDFC